MITCSFLAGLLFLATPERTAIIPVDMLDVAQVVEYNSTAIVIKHSGGNSNPILRNVTVSDFNEAILNCTPVNLEQNSIDQLMDE